MLPNHMILTILVNEVIILYALGDNTIKTKQKNQLFTVVIVLLKKGKENIKQTTTNYRTQLTNWLFPYLSVETF